MIVVTSIGFALYGADVTIISTPVAAYSSMFSNVMPPPTPTMILSLIFLISLTIFSRSFGETLSNYM
jgi:hypothetical protein